jgi:hypothetical protein
MENPYRVHSSIGFGFLQLLMLSSLAYPTPPPPFYHNIALLRMMGTVYFTIFQGKPIYLKLECVTILLEVIRDALYMRYIIQDYTYIFVVFDIISNLLFCIAIGLSFENGEEQWAKISERLEGIRKTCMGLCWKSSSQENAVHTNHLYKSLSSNDTETDEAPIYTFNGRQPFKPSFYSSSWGREYINAKVEREFDRIDTTNVYNHGSDSIGMISNTDGTTEYIRFDDTSANHYANIFVSPYFTKDGTRITSFSGWTKADSVGFCLFIYNLFQFIYQLLIYHSIVRSCREVHAAMAENQTILTNEKMMRWLC